MFAKKVQGSDKKIGDLELLLASMDNVIAGQYGNVDTSVFSDQEVGEKLNQMIHAFKRSNNNFVMRLNNAMMSIGDNSYIKNMFDQVNLQTSSIEDMKISSKDLESSIQNISNSVSHIKDNTYEVLKSSEKSEVNMNESIRVVNESSEEIAKINIQVQTFREKINKISEIIDMVKKIASQSNLLALNASIEAARAGEAGKGFAVVADQVRQLSSNTSASAEDIVRTVTELQAGIGNLAAAMDVTTNRLSDGNQKVEQSVKDIQLMNDQINIIREEIDSIYSAVDTQSEVTKEFSVQIDNISESYNELSRDCMEAGHHMFRSGKNIDTVRSDMVRGFSEITPLDWMRVFEIDHFILTWRVYNNAVGFENLTLAQLNNPTGCKLGKWIGEQKDPKLTSSAGFKELVNCHNELHKSAVDSWTAKERGDIDGAIRYFNATLDIYPKLQKAINKAKDVVRSLGNREETEVVIFKV